MRVRDECFTLCILEVNSESHPMDANNKVAKEITQFDVSPNLFQKFTSSISHLSLAVLISDSDHQIWRLFRLKVMIMMLRKTLASVTTGLLTRIMLHFRHALFTA